ncbi:uncharacterized protein GLRG_07111 [Colletotrichum graminicola M1.001]|uniref:Uncharacterized protein n=1 Tax=Colletotrichum graminicola (strain M1.001 / M2 / FGSC 10212) TaxID=645133 RepID=E3QM79_COLGM|nr:uncharacterized protein GLRG_07111 [Colletotrichum graminicola M1.001]EFQ31967.1 hypothetical protein GLRG_07111 [Colletotrichum graminicola M1.001]
MCPFWESPDPVSRQTELPARTRTFRSGSTSTSVLVSG